MENENKEYIVTIDGADCTGKSFLWTQAIVSTNKNIQIRGIVSNIAYALKYNRNVDELIELYNKNPLDYVVYLLNPINDKRLEMLYNRIRNTMIYDNDKIVKELKDASDTWNDYKFFESALELLHEKYKGDIIVFKAKDNTLETFNNYINMFKIKEITTELNSPGVRVLKTPSDRFEERAKDFSEFRYIVLYKDCDKNQVMQNLYEGLDDDYKEMYDNLIEYCSESNANIYDLLEELTVECLVEFLENYEFKVTVSAGVELRCESDVYIPLRNTINRRSLEDIVYDDDYIMNDILEELSNDLRYSDIDIEIDRVW